MKSLVMFCLCVPLLWALGSQIRFLAGDTDTAGRDSSADAPKELKGRIEKAQALSDVYTQMARTIVTISGEPIDDDRALPAPERELAARLNDYARMLRETRLAMDVLQARRPRKDLPAAWRSWCDTVDRPEKLYADLRRNIARLNPDTLAEGDSSLAKQIEECRSEWAKLQDGPFHPERGKLVREYLKTARQLVDLQAQPAGDGLFDALNDLGESRFEELGAFTKKLAASRARGTHYWLGKLEYEPVIMVNRAEVIRADSWERYDAKRIWFLFDGGKREVTVHENPELQFKHEGPFWGNMVKKYLDADDGPDGYKGRLRPTDKNVAAYAYNKTWESVRTTGDVTRLQQRLAEHYRDAARSDELRKQALDNAFAIQQLKKHHPAQGEKLEQLIAVVSRCSRLFP